MSGGFGTLSRPDLEVTVRLAPGVSLKAAVPFQHLAAYQEMFLVKLHVFSRSALMHGRQLAKGFPEDLKVHQI